ncbi:VOC family protein [Bdellovibrio sp. NC01]|uniref:VOC family protein n=1 Tax=Bdellovibrio sp. NC01 TaxID=2220073 RepID=UPI0011570B1D|nr:VOC family protein [Bdellovibrio sp. NC01]QDK37291.1 VOC family protein [Bdellovibrio sp. NC01]
MRLEGFGEYYKKSNDPQKLTQWYEEHMGLHHEDDGEVMLPDSSFKPVDMSYFSPSTEMSKLTFQVENLNQALQDLTEEGVKVDDNLHETEFGRFAWVYDLEGNRIELWEPRPYYYNPVDLGEPE